MDFITLINFFHGFLCLLFILPIIFTLILGPVGSRFPLETFFYYLKHFVLSFIYRKNEPFFWILRDIFNEGFYCNYLSGPSFQKRKIVSFDYNFIRMGVGFNSISVRSIMVECEEMIDMIDCVQSILLREPFDLKPNSKSRADGLYKLQFLVKDFSSSFDRDKSYLMKSLSDLLNYYCFFESEESKAIREIILNNFNLLYFDDSNSEDKALLSKKIKIDVENYILRGSFYNFNTGFQITVEIKEKFSKSYNNVKICVISKNDYLIEEELFQLNLPGVLCIKSMFSFMKESNCPLLSSEIGEGLYHCLGMKDSVDQVLLKRDIYRSKTKKTFCIIGDGYGFITFLLSLYSFFIMTILVWNFNFLERVFVLFMTMVFLLICLAIRFSRVDYGFIAFKLIFQCVFRKIPSLGEEMYLNYLSLKSQLVPCLWRERKIRFSRVQGNYDKFMFIGNKSYSGMKRIGTIDSSDVDVESFSCLVGDFRISCIITENDCENQALRFSIHWGLKWNLNKSIETSSDKVSHLKFKIFKKIIIEMSCDKSNLGCVSNCVNGKLMGTIHMMGIEEMVETLPSLENNEITVFKSTRSMLIADCGIHLGKKFSTAMKFCSNFSGAESLILILHNLMFFKNSKNIDLIYNFPPGSKCNHSRKFLKDRLGNKEFKKYVSDISILYLKINRKPIYMVDILNPSEALIKSCGISGKVGEVRYKKPLDNSLYIEADEKTFPIFNELQSFMRFEAKTIIFKPEINLKLDEVISQINELEKEEALNMGMEKNSSVEIPLNDSDDLKVRREKILDSVLMATEEVFSEIEDKGAISMFKPVIDKMRVIPNEVLISNKRIEIENKKIEHRNEYENCVRDLKDFEVKLRSLPKKKSEKAPVVKLMKEREKDLEFHSKKMKDLDKNLNIKVREKRVIICKSDKQIINYFWVYKKMKFTDHHKFEENSVESNLISKDGLNIPYVKEKIPKIETRDKNEGYKFPKKVSKKVFKGNKIIGDFFSLNNYYSPLLEDISVGVSSTEKLIDLVSVNQLKCKSNKDIQEKTRQGKKIPKKDFEITGLDIPRLKWLKPMERKLKLDFLKRKSKTKNNKSNGSENRGHYNEGGKSKSKKILSLKDQISIQNSRCQLIFTKIENQLRMSCLGFFKGRKKNFWDKDERRLNRSLNSELRKGFNEYLNKNKNKNKNKNEDELDSSSGGKEKLNEEENEIFQTISSLMNHEEKDLSPKERKVIEVLRRYEFIEKLSVNSTYVEKEVVVEECA